MTIFHQPFRCFLHQTDSLALRMKSPKHLGVIRLRYAEIEIPVQLLHRRIIVGMDDLRVRRVGNLIPGFHRVSGKNHILVENGFLRKSAKLQVNIPPVCRADIGTEVGLNPQGVEI